VGFLLGVKKLFCGDFKMKQSIGIIGGTGWMGKALADAFLQTKVLSPQQLWIANRSGVNPFLEHYPEVHLTLDVQSLVDACDIIFIAVLPQHFHALEVNLNGKCVVSIMAMVSVAAIGRQLHTDNIVRTMPNAAIPELKAYTPWYAEKSVSEQDKEAVRILLDSCGTQAEVEQEDQLNFLTALTGSSHGWLAYVAQTLMQVGVEHGLTEAFIEQAVRSVMQGVGALIAHEKPSPAETVKILTEYAGSTATGLIAFDKAKVATGLRKGILASYARASKPF
jgi:pyrroline-5-carboxylate reductase